MVLTSPRMQKLMQARQLAELCARLDIPLGDATSPGQLATLLDPQNSVQRPHLEVIDNALTHLLATPQAQLMIWTPSQVGKSTRVSVAFPFWWMTRRPRDRILNASAEERLARRNGAAVRELVREHGAAYGLNLVADEGSKTDWSIRAGGSMRSRGLRGNFTGQPLDLGIIDDPITSRAQAESLQQRDFVWDWYSSVWSQRKAPTYREVIVMTRWHEDDLAGRLLARDGRVEDGGKWIVIHLPAIALAPDPLRGIYDDPLGRKPGEPLTHPLIESDDVDALVEWWAQKRAMSTARDWAAMSQGVPSDATTALLSEAAIRKATAPAPARADLRRVAVAVDPSGGEGEKHDTAGIGVVGLDADGKAWVLDDRTAVLSPLEWPRRVCEVAAEHDAGTIVYEKNYGGGMTKVLVQQAWAELQRERADAIAAAGDDPLAVEAAEQVGIAGDRNCPHIKGVTGRVSKVLRAEPIAQAVLTGRVQFARDADLTTLTNEWRLWQPGSTWSPGALDANVYGLTEVLPPVESRTKVTRPSGGRQQGARGSAQFAGRRRTA